MNHDASFLRRRIAEREQAVDNLAKQRQELRELPFIQRLRIGNIGMRLWIYTSMGRQKDTLAAMRQQLNELS